MDVIDSKDCPFTNNPYTNVIDSQGFDGVELQCDCCGHYRISASLLESLTEEFSKEDDPTELRLLIRHSLRKMQDKGKIPSLTSTLFEHIKFNEKLPSFGEQADLILLYMVDNAHAPEYQIDFEGMAHSSIIGTSQYGLFHVARQLEKEGLIQLDENDVLGNGDFTACLTLDGWRRVEELKRGHSMSRKAFMAMKFGDPELDGFVESGFRSAVEETGFRLFRLDDESKAGLIDDRMRVEIQTSRFLISDITHGNNGAYWEAGYAEGLGMPVIYTCKESVFNEKGTHFDTNHHLTVMWNPDKPEEFQQRLKDTIRATLPADAKMTDD